MKMHKGQKGKWYIAASLCIPGAGKKTRTKLWVCDRCCDTASPCPWWAWACCGHVKMHQASGITPGAPSQLPRPCHGRKEGRRYCRDLPRQKQGRWSSHLAALQEFRSYKPSSALVHPCHTRVRLLPHPFGESDLAERIRDSIYFQTLAWK